MGLDQENETCSTSRPMELEERSRRILEIAVELAEEGGFDAVRQRDVAARAGVALGTLYKRFPSKEGILVAALEMETIKMVKKLESQPITGDTPEERVANLFRTMTRGLCRKPNLAKALIKALTSGEPELTERVASYHTGLKELIARTMCSLDGSVTPSEIELEVAFTLQQIWFAALVGWMGGLHSQNAIVDRVAMPAQWMLRGIQQAQP
jgi:AcrR family transcriptional regulator